MDIQLKENERIDDLELNNLKIIQNKNGFCFGIDSVLLSDFAKNIKKNSKVIDLGTGNGIIPILLSAKTKAKKICGIEIQKDVAEMAQKSIIINNLQDKINIINGNLKELIKEQEKYDVVVTNPPYMKLDSGLQNENESKLIARHEKECNIEDIARVSFKILKDNGEVYMVHRPERLVDILYLFRKYKLEIKNIRFVHSKKTTQAVLVLIKAVKNGKPFLKIDKPLYVYNQNGKYSEEILNIYNK
ncbi:MAG: tRNA1(Val) (adenine(37)-N6)-methyltransferase [Mycoplasmataceae bacterium]|nr:tRNA1(Val) (adenine(37)-N6)-methyltransferase [Mycoplasmataceae bacterium]